MGMTTICALGVGVTVVNGGDQDDDSADDGRFGRANVRAYVRFFLGTHLA